MYSLIVLSVLGHFGLGMYSITSVKTPFSLKVVSSWANCRFPFSLCSISLSPIALGVSRTVLVTKIFPVEMHSTFVTTVSLN